MLAASGDRSGRGIAANPDLVAGDEEQGRCRGVSNRADHRGRIHPVQENFCFEIDHVTRRLSLSGISSWPIAGEVVIVEQMRLVRTELGHSTTVLPDGDYSGLAEG
jgi:hypothetical protein